MSFLVNPYRFAWSPLSENPFLYYHIRPENLWQDSARTTAVTADGDPIGCIDNLGSLGSDGDYIASGSDRPTYKTDGTYHWADFGGTQGMANRANITLGKYITVVSAWKRDVLGVQILYEYSPTYGSNQGIIAYTNSSPSLRIAASANITGSIHNGWFSADIYALADPFVHSHQVNVDGTSKDTEQPYYRINGSSAKVNNEQNAPWTNGTTGISGDKFYLGARTGIALPLDGRFYGKALYTENKSLAVMNQIEQFLGDEAGATVA